MSDAYVQATGALRILSVEDEPDTLAGPLDSLDLAGHQIERAEDLITARQFLTDEPFDLLLVDQRLGGSGELLEAGSRLVTWLKEGELGELNRKIEFLFVTGSDQWVDEDEMRALQGYEGLLIKVSPITQRLLATSEAIARRKTASAADDVVRADPAQNQLLDRVLLRIVGQTGDDIVAVVPSWDLHEVVRFPVGLLPRELHDGSELEGRRLFGWMNLRARDAAEIEFRDLEIAPEPSEDDEFS
jgi:CheY-like chemotaxis protein